MQSGGQGLCRDGRGGGGASTCPSATPDQQVLADDGSPRRGGPAAVPPRGIEPRPLLVVVPAGGPSRRVGTAVDGRKTTCSAIVRNIDMFSRMRNSTPVHTVHGVNMGEGVMGMCGGGRCAGLGPRGRDRSRPADGSSSEVNGRGEKF